MSSDGAKISDNTRPYNQLTVHDYIHRRSSLPEAIRFDRVSPEDPIDELRYFIRGREIAIRSLLYRPFVYLAIHHPPQDHTEMLRVRSLAHKAISICMMVDPGHSMSHRHHGTWYGLRESISAGLMLVASKMSGLIPDETAFPNGELNDSVYMHLVEAYLQKLRYWEAEAPSDVRRGREMLEELHAQG